MRKVLHFLWLVLTRCETEFDDCFEPKGDA